MSHKLDNTIQCVQVDFFLEQIKLVLRRISSSIILFKKKLENDKFIHIEHML